MTHDQAQKILNKVRDGVHYPAQIVDKALFLTGDLGAYEKVRSQGMDQTLQSESQGDWSHASSRMVGRRYFGH